VTADRVLLGCYGVNGGKAGKPFVVTVDPGGARERSLGGLVDGEPVRAGEIVSVQTTGGGGWGDPLEREVERVCLDVLQGKISADAARSDYGVVLKDGAPNSPPIADEAATAAERRCLRAERAEPLPVIDRGPGGPPKGQD
jgi:N-methylhydantoinase B